MVAIESVVSRAVNLYDCDIMESISLGSLESIGTYLNIYYNEQLVRANFTNLTVVEAYIAVQSNWKLRFLNFSKLETVRVRFRLTAI